MMCLVPSAERIDDVQLPLLGRVDEKAVPLRDVHFQVHRQVIAVQHNLHKHLSTVIRGEEGRRVVLSTPLQPHKRGEKERVA
jgi:hypothetical protein